VYDAHGVWLLVYTRTDVRADGLLIGAIAAVVGAAPIANRLPRGAGWVGFGVFVAAVLTVERESSWLYETGFVVVALAAALMVVTAAAGSWGATRVLGSRPLVWVGRRSYSLYLWHFLVFVLVRDVDGSAVRIGGGLALTVAAAALSYRLVEQPFLRLKDRFSTQAGQPVPTSMARIPSPMRKSPPNP
jgi:peptidoglycan/LPS O-acetylase OafA/YrhL